MPAMAGPDRGKRCLKILIITVDLNRFGFIEDCIKSVLSQTYENIEYIVIDGGSTYGTMKKIRTEKQKTDLILSIMVQ